MKNKNWKDISYLKFGNFKQRKIYEILINTKILNILNDYTPVLVGTIPIGIDIENSDLDLVCKVDNFEIFKEVLINNFKKYRNFKIAHKEENVLVCNFIVNDIEIEIYGSSDDIDKSNGYRHMIIEDRLLNLYGDDFTKQIISLKDKGLKTEPAFAKVLDLQGNPYEQLLLLEMYSDEELYKIYNK
ncbi:DUF4269 domain-containing protein [Tepidibacter aestuarii]|uniref:DUF4269 domain-containing protein n=1 Tax=Tepidibacter aestuarii TaxID=2925782 RepID=UPI0020BF9652|nr:DUF4269 domain-containing protein [Tepidibacter aestuarii]CAH2213473.1 conserved protein of unknown function [Tepidibacter aestuarii]